MLENMVVCGLINTEGISSTIQKSGTIWKIT